MLEVDENEEEVGVSRSTKKIRTANADSLLPNQERNLALTYKGAMSILMILTYET